MNILGIQIGKGGKLQPIFVTKRDRDEFFKLENKTKAQLKVYHTDNIYLEIKFQHIFYLTN